MASTLAKSWTTEDIFASEPGTIYDAASLHSKNPAAGSAQGLPVNASLELLRAVKSSKSQQARHIGPHAYQEHVEPYVISPAVRNQPRRRVALVTQVNRVLQTVLIVFCGVAIVGYGLDVATSSRIAKLQEQTRRLDEQNSELSAQLLKSISFEGIQENILDRKRLRVPEQVMIVSEVPPAKMEPFKPHEHHLPIMSGY